MSNYGTPTYGPAMGQDTPGQYQQPRYSYGQPQQQPAYGAQQHPQQGQHHQFSPPLPAVDHQLASAMAGMAIENPPTPRQTPHTPQPPQAQSWAYPHHHSLGSQATPGPQHQGYAASSPRPVAVPLGAQPVHAQSAPLQSHSSAHQAAVYTPPTTTSLSSQSAPKIGDMASSVFRKETMDSVGKWSKKTVSLLGGAVKNAVSNAQAAAAPRPRPPSTYGTTPVTVQQSGPSATGTTSGYGPNSNLVYRPDSPIHRDAQHPPAWPGSTAPAAVDANPALGSTPAQGTPGAYQHATAPWNGGQAQASQRVAVPQPGHEYGSLGLDHQPPVRTINDQPQQLWSQAWSPPPPLGPGAASQSQPQFQGVPNAPIPAPSSAPAPAQTQVHGRPQPHVPHPAVGTGTPQAIRAAPGVGSGPPLHPNYPNHPGALRGRGGFRGRGSGGCRGGRGGGPPPPPPPTSAPGTPGAPGEAKASKAGSNGKKKKWYAAGGVGLAAALAVGTLAALGGDASGFDFGDGDEDGDAGGDDAGRESGGSEGATYADGAGGWNGDPAGGYDADGTHWAEDNHEEYAAAVQDAHAVATSEYATALEGAQVTTAPEYGASSGEYAAYEYGTGGGGGLQDSQAALLEQMQANHFANVMAHQANVNALSYVGDVEYKTVYETSYGGGGPASYI
ncbi:hypothetical protein MMYC01_201053 [Madurella mycetomatis]|uniref:Uncharacterized protein n=1 Tax=Madurella mycetomatis TaxID=100816 RepID=A0A175WIC8_9PEZI|nr:hypothetical protein MMYC01_208491 [Madurella mycetomatis]KXX82644.1 hypothetical protein MMYC01_201053 [Madurella mycetomatis]